MGRIALVSIAPYVIGKQRNHAIGLVFAACEGGKKFSIAFTEDRTEHKRIWENLTSFNDIPIPITGEEVAKDFMTNEWLDREGVFECADKFCRTKDCNHTIAGHKSVEECGIPGCMCMGITVSPTDAELSNAKAVRLSWLDRYIQQGDEEYAKNKRIDQVPDYCKRAATERKVSREWVFTPPVENAEFECVGCGSSIRYLKDGSKPAVCIRCNAVLNREAAVALNILKEDLTIPIKTQPVDLGQGLDVKKKAQ